MRLVQPVIALQEQIDEVMALNHRLGDIGVNGAVRLDEGDEQSAGIGNGRETEGDAQPGIVVLRVVHAEAAQDRPGGEAGAP